jgi:short-subunit dehydrogenase
MRPLRDQVIVITGASSGIGRETALEAARRGARLVLAARNQDALESVAFEAERLGGAALVVPTDVGDNRQVVDLGRQAVDRFGRIDTWVNNAAVSSYGTAEQTDVEDIRRVIDVNLLGHIQGMKAALPHLRAGGGGTIINVSSALGKRSVPLQAAYCAAKHGVVAFGEALRLELESEGVDIHIVDVLPSSINTPLFEHAKSMLGVRPRPIAPIYEPSTVAEAILATAEQPVRQVFVGFAGRMLDLGQRISPWLLDRLLLGPARIIDSQKTDVIDDGRSNLFDAAGDAGRTAGQFGETSRSTSIYTRHVGLRPRRGLLAAGLALAVIATRHRGSRR